MTNWIDTSSSFNGKQLHAVHRLDDNTFLDCHLWYTQNVPAGKKLYELNRKELKEAGYHVTLHVTKMRRTESGTAFTGGFGNSAKVDHTMYKTMSLKGLQQAATKITLDHILSMGGAQTTEPSLIVG
jgi:spermidine synthase